FESLAADVLAALLALAVAAVVDAAERFLDLHDELALAVADAKREVAVRLQRGTVGRVGEVLGLRVGHAVDGAIGLAQQLLELLVQKALEVLEVAFAHRAPLEGAKG